MSSQKEKLLSSAQKFILKGQLDRAIKDYEQVVSLDPSDIRHKQKLAELLVKLNRKDDALREYEEIGKHYDRNGFYLKAIAVFKQIQKLDRENLDVYLTLAELNEKQGLVGNALAEYKILVDYYEKSGNTGEMLKILERMLAADPENLNIHMKLAETHFAMGLLDSSYQEYIKIADSLKKRGDEKLFERVSHRIQTIFPDRQDFALDVIEKQAKSGDPDAIAQLNKLLHADSANLQLLAILAEAYGQAGETDKRRDILNRIIALSPGDISAASSLIETCIEAGDIHNALISLSNTADKFISADAFSPLEGHYNALLHISPGNVQALEGLMALFQASGESEKLSGILSLLNPQPPLESAPSAEEVPSLPQEVVAPISATAASAEPEEFPWEEEIELSFPGDALLEASGEGLQEEAPGYEADQTEISFDLSSSPSLDAPEAGAESTYGVEFNADVPETPAIGGAEGLVEIEFDVQESDFTPDELSDSVAEPVPPNLETEQGEPLHSFEEGEETTLALSANIAPHEEFLFDPSDSFDIDLSFPEEVATKAGEEAGGKESGKYSMDGVFREFKKSVDSQLDKEDTETHYNLGIAYKEMGLLDDAIAEFKVAASDPHRRLDCLTLEGICSKEKGDLKGAEKAFREGLASDGATQEGVLSLKYELALLYEESGDMERAREAFGEVARMNSGFRDTVRKLEALGGEVEAELSELELVEIEDEQE